MTRPSRETIGERRLTHGHTVGNGKASPTYESWANMIQRCCNPNNTGYPRYGGMGITVCRRWRKFENFLSDMGIRPAAMTLDRFPNKRGNYEPGNCRWATWSEQRRNQSRIRPVIRNDGVCHPTIIEAAQAIGGNRRCIWDVLTGRQKTHLGYTWSYAND